MKPIAYIKKYKINESIHFDRVQFNKDFVADFDTLLAEYQKEGAEKLNYLKFKYATQEMRRKFDQIGTKSGKILPETIWKYFWATTVIPMRGEKFPIARPA